MHGQAFGAFHHLRLSYGRLNAEQAVIAADRLKRGFEHLIIISNQRKSINSTTTNNNN